MSKQLTIKEFIKKYNKSPDKMQLEILDLEKKYMMDIVKVLKSDDFQKSLINVEQILQDHIKSGKLRTFEKFNEHFR